jgi:hypothetical protein
MLLPREIVFSPWRWMKRQIIIIADTGDPFFTRIESLSLHDSPDLLHDPWSGYQRRREKPGEKPQISVYPRDSPTYYNFNN